ncbi:MAG: Holliday junction branch migration protein RuvA [Proteobacteria bacterium]|nr:Holliday junction branch migration protein RuvA [Pseudomonadota bacterium]
MISTLTGPVLEVTATAAVIDCSGVGYAAFCPMRTMAGLTTGQTARLYTVLNVREDALTLFGFATPAERSFFEQLTTVSGVGPRIGLSLLSSFTPADIQQAILTNQPGQLSRASGVGKKLAEKIIVELKDKLASVAILAPAAGPAASGLLADLTSALTNLGYPAKTAQAAAEQALQANPKATFEDLFKTALHKAA